MIKLLYSSAFQNTVDVRMSIVESSEGLMKRASTIFGDDYDAMAPDKNHVGIHVVALGAFEHYGANRNADGFPKQACVAYHPTFVKHGHVYRHHKNKDPQKALGNIVKSAYNQEMGRVELYIHAHKEKARDELQKLAEDGEIPFSMACKVPYDRCSVRGCGRLRKSASDPNQCTHVLEKLGQVLDDGQVVCTHNDQPRFFDISFVSRPADRIAWQLKVASDGSVDSVKLAADSGIWVPDHVAIDSPVALAKLELLHKLASAEREFQRLSATLVLSTHDRYCWELRKAASAPMPDAALEKLREFMPEDTFRGLAKRAVVLDASQFFKYALGPDFGEIEPYLPGIQAVLPGIFSRIEKEGRCQRVCNNSTFDVDVSRHTYDLSQPLTGYEKVAHAASFRTDAAEQRIITATLNGTNPEIHLDKLEKMGNHCDDNTVVLAEKYAAYKVAAVKAIIELNENTDKDALLMLSVAQNFVNT
jgi:hypothetical protein